MSSLLFRIHQKLRISFLSCQKLNKNYDRVKVDLFLGNSSHESFQKNASFQTSSFIKEKYMWATAAQIVFLKQLQLHSLSSL